MKGFLFTLILTICATQVQALDLRVGDVVVQPLKCWSCTAIGDENGTEFSHSVIVLQVKPTVLFAEALGSVKTLSLDFLERRLLMEGTKNIVLRHKDLNKLYKNSPRAFKEFETDLKRTFYGQYKGLPFDHSFLWNNYSDEGEELYCSEFVTKILNPYLKRKIKTEPMDFSMNWDFWNTYFGHTPPQGKEGNSPSTFYLSKDFIKVGPL